MLLVWFEFCWKEKKNEVSNKGKISKKVNKQKRHSVCKALIFSPFALLFLVIENPSSKRTQKSFMQAEKIRLVKRDHYQEKIDASPSQGSSCEHGCLVS